jgi:hypothetical protein
MSRFKGSYRDCTILPARLKASRCPQWHRDVFSASWQRHRRRVPLGNLRRIARELAPTAGVQHVEFKIANGPSKLQ